MAPRTIYGTAGAQRSMQVVRIIVCILSFGFIFPHAFVESTDADPGTSRPLRGGDALVVESLRVPK
jgi:hypothetical protein